jgi:hypothetical protein
MSKYPTENSLTINNTHQMLSNFDTKNSQVAATSPSRRREKGHGYDVQYTFVKRIQFQYKRPKYQHNSRGLCFKINNDQVTTLRLRDARRIAYLACPYVTNQSQLKDTLSRTIFIDAQAVRGNTTRLFIPEDYSDANDPSSVNESVTALFNDGNKRDYYEIPDNSIFVWDTIESSINTRKIGQVVRDNGELTQPYKQFVERLSTLMNLYNPASPSGVATDGGEPEDRNNQVDEQAMERLVNHATREHQQIYLEDAEHDIEQDNDVISEDRRGLVDGIEQMSGVRDPQVHGIRRSREIIYESGEMNTAFEMGRM